MKRTKIVETEGALKDRTDTRDRNRHLGSPQSNGIHGEEARKTATFKHLQRVQQILKSAQWQEQDPTARQKESSWGLVSVKTAIQTKHKLLFSLSIKMSQDDEFFWEYLPQYQVGGGSSEYLESPETSRYVKH